MLELQNSGTVKIEKIPFEAKQKETVEKILAIFLKIYQHKLKETRDALLVQQKSEKSVETELTKIWKELTIQMQHDVITAIKMTYPGKDESWYSRIAGAVKLPDATTVIEEIKKVVIENPGKKIIIGNGSMEWGPFSMP